MDDQTGRASAEPVPNATDPPPWVSNAIKQGITRAGKTIRNIRSAWIKEQQLRLENNVVAEYQVNMLVTFVLEE